MTPEPAKAYEGRNFGLLSRWPWRGPLLSVPPSKFATRVGCPEEMQRIAAQVAARHGLTVADLKGRSQVAKIAKPRQEAMAAILATGRFSSVTAGRFFNRDHTTALYARRVIEARALTQREAA